MSKIIFWKISVPFDQSLSVPIGVFFSKFPVEWKAPNEKYNGHPSSETLPGADSGDVDKIGAGDLQKYEEKIIGSYFSFVL